MWVFALYTIADGYFVSRYVGEIGFSAVNISLPIITSFFALGILLSIGTQAKVGFNLGKGDVCAAQEIFTTGAASLVVLGLIYTLIIMVFLSDIVIFLGANDITFYLVKEYLQVLVPFGVFFMITYQLEVLVKIDGFPNFAAYSVFFAALVNLALDYIFIVELHMGMFGAGLATGLAQLLSAMLLFTHFACHRGKIHFVRKWRPSCLRSLVTIGVGDALAEIAVGYTVFLFNTTLLRVLGQDGILVYTVISYISIFAQVTMTGIAQGLSPLFSYDYGRRNFLKIKESALFGLSFIFLVSFLSITVIHGCSVSLAKIFLPENSLIADEAAAALKKYSFSYLFTGINILFITFFASLGKGRAAAVLSLLRTPILITGIMFFYENFIGGNFIWYLLTISEGLTLLIGIFLLKYHNLPMLRIS